MQKTLTVRVPDGVYDRVSREAESQRIGVADYIRKCLAEQLESDHVAERLAALEARINDRIDRGINQVLAAVTKRTNSNADSAVPHGKRTNDSGKEKPAILYVDNLLLKGGMDGLPSRVRDTIRGRYFNNGTSPGELSEPEMSDGAKLLNEILQLAIKRDPHEPVNEFMVLLADRLGEPEEHIASKAGV